MGIIYDLSRKAASGQGLKFVLIYGEKIFFDFFQFFEEFLKK